MSYLHCPTCRRAYNLAVEPACPSCGVRPGAPPADPVDDVVAAAEQLARAVARATPDELTAAEQRLDARSAQPLLGDGMASAMARGQPASSIAMSARAGGQSAVAAAPLYLRAVRAALSPRAPDPTAQQALLTTVALALLARLAAPPRPLRWARALLARR